MLFLTEHGITSGRAVRIYRTYGQESIAKIKANPFQLADDIRGIGFKTADELAAKVGIDRNSPFRARAAVQYSLRELAGDGHCGYPEPGVVEHTTKLVEIDQNIVEEAVQFGVGTGVVVRLAEILRQAAESQIVTAAYAINQGQIPKLSDEIGDWGGDITKAKLPDKFLVDYVRVYDLVDEK